MANLRMIIEQRGQDVAMTLLALGYITGFFIAVELAICKVAIF